MNTKITFVHTNNFSEALPNDGFDTQKDFVVVGEEYTYEDWLSDSGVEYEKQDNDFFVLDDGERTGEAFRIISELPTDEELQK